MLIDGYKHMSGQNCESSSQRNVLSYLGINLEEDVIFGLDGGFGFMFFQNSDEKIDIIVGKNEIFPGRAMKLLGAKVEKYNSFTGSKGWEIICKKYIDCNIPLIARVDHAYLPYWQTPKEAHFGGHFVVLCGYDNDSNSVYLSDSGFSEIKNISKEDFVKARSSIESPPVNPCSELYVILQPVREPDITKTGPVALRGIVRNFLFSTMSSTGHKGLKQFLKSMKAWPDVKKGKIKETQYNGTEVCMDTLNFQVKQTGRFIEVFGTGGGCYRKIFGNFLKILYEKTGNHVFNESAGIINQSAMLWETIGKSFLNITEHTSKEEIKTLLNKSVSELEKIIKFENDAFEILKRV